MIYTKDKVFKIWLKKRNLPIENVDREIMMMMNLERCLIMF